MLRICRLALHKISSFISDFGTIIHKNNLVIDDFLCRKAQKNKLTIDELTIDNFFRRETRDERRETRAENGKSQSAPLTTLTPLTTLIYLRRDNLESPRQPKKNLSTLYFCRK